MDFDKMADKVFQAIQQRIEKAIGPFQGRLDALHEQIKALPLPKDGKDGRDGVDGKDAPAPDMEVLAREVHKLIPVPADGKDGRDGVDGKDGAKGIDGKDGRDGTDGKSFTLEEVQSLVSKAMVEKQAEWALDFERRATERHDRWLAALPKPKDGKDGRDAIDVEGFDMSLDGRDLTVSLKRGDAVIASKSIRIPGFEDRGVYRDTEQYLKGDGVSFGGSFFIAQRDAPEGKPEQSRDWRCVVKRGRDGKDGRNGIDKTSSVKVP